MKLFRPLKSTVKNQTAQTYSKLNRTVYNNNTNNRIAMLGFKLLKINIKIIEVPSASFCKNPATFNFKVNFKLKYTTENLN